MAQLRRSPPRNAKRRDRHGPFEPGLIGLDVLPRLRAERVHSKVIVLTMHNDPKLATIAMRESAFRFLLKEWVNPARCHRNHSRVRLCSTPLLS